MSSTAVMDSFDAPGSVLKDTDNLPGGDKGKAGGGGIPSSLVSTSKTGRRSLTGINSALAGTAVAENTLPPSTKKVKMTTIFGTFNRRGSPEEGSGQDRFRKMMETAPPYQSAAPAAADLDRQIPPPPATGRESSTVIRYSPAHAVTGTPQFTLQTISTSQLKKPEPRAASGGNPGVKAEADASPPEATGSDQCRGRDEKGSNPGAWNSRTAVLSHECQKRSFNPSFIEWKTKDGAYMCSVDVRGKIVEIDRGFANAIDAKQAAAAEAIKVVRRMPVTDPAVRAAKQAAREITKYETTHETNFREGAFAWGERALTKSQHPPIRYAPRGITYTYPAVPAAPIVAEQARVYGDGRDPDEERHLLHRIRTLYGRSGTPSQHTLAHPVAAQAFLEGFALGGRLHEIAVRQQAEADLSHSGWPHVERGYTTYPYQRERSPAPRAGSSYRERSPLRSGPYRI